MTEAALPAAVGGRPSRLPCDRACAKPARTRSRIMSLSNSAKTESSPAIARPAGVVRSNASVTETNPHQAPSVLATSTPDQGPTGPTDPIAKPEPHQCHAVARNRSAAHASRATAPEPTSLHPSATVQPRFKADSRSVRPHLQGNRLLIQRGGPVIGHEPVDRPDLDVPRHCRRQLGFRHRRGDQPCRGISRKLGQMAGLVGRDQPFFRSFTSGSVQWGNPPWKIRR